MYALLQFQYVIPKILVIIFFLWGSPAIQAQNKSVTDTIAYLIQSQKNHIQLCDDLNKLGNYYKNTGDIESAQLALNKSLAMAKQFDYPKAIYDALTMLTSISFRQNDRAKALTLYDECLTLATKNHNDYGMNKAKYSLVMMLYMQGNMDSVISLSKNVLETPRTVYDSVNLPNFITMIGNAYLTKGDFQTANRYYLEALDLAERTRNQELQSVCISNLAGINQQLMNEREALKYQRKALAIALQNNQVREEAGIYVGIGNIYYSLTLMDSAIYFYKKAIPLFKLVDSKADIALVNTHLGGALVLLNQLDSGMYYLASAKHDLILLNDTIHLAENAYTTGDAWYKMALAKQDQTYTNKALAEMLVCKKLTELKELEDGKMQCYFYLSIIYEALGNKTEAFNYLKRYNNLNDTLRSQQFTQQIAEMQTKYESGKKETEIAKLNAEKLLGAAKISRQRVFNYSLLAMAGLILVSGSVVYRNVQKKRTAEKQVAILEKQNAIETMRTKIASDVHDDMGANLTRLGLNAQQLLQNAKLPDSEKQLVEKMALQSKDIITGMREIIWASNPANDNLKSMLGFMRQYIDRFFDGTNIRPIVNFPYEVGEITLHPEVRRNLFLILKESLNNAVKYSGSDRIDIDFQNQNEKFNLDIKDYGKGFDEKNKDDYSNGLHNMQMRAELIQSLFKLITAPGQGVKISVEGKLY